jgi:hydrogenase small subunit
MSAITEIDVLWVTAGLGCDGDTIAMTAATQPSLEELMFGALPFVPRIKLHNPFLSYENGEEFMQVFHRAADGNLNLLFWWSKARFRTKPIKKKATGPALAPTKELGNRFSPAIGLTGLHQKPGP